MLRRGTVEGSLNFYDNHLGCGTAADKALAARLGGHSRGTQSCAQVDGFRFTRLERFETGHLQQVSGLICSFLFRLATTAQATTSSVTCLGARNCKDSLAPLADKEYPESS